MKGRLKGTSLCMSIGAQPNSFTSICWPLLAYTARALHQQRSKMPCSIGLARCT